jgi:hypothetical protein
MKTSKRNKIIYWIATLWLALGMFSTGIVQVLQVEEQVAPILQLGYPAYFIQLLGISKLLGLIIVLLPGLRLLKEWAYAGFIFMMGGAIYSHLAKGAPEAIFPALLLLCLTLISWHLRPKERKIDLT